MTLLLVKKAAYPEDKGFNVVFIVGIQPVQQSFFLIALFTYITSVNVLPPTGGGGVQQSSLSGQGGHGAAAAHVGPVALHLGLSSVRGIHRFP